jgi:outer membrane protein TolC
MTHWMTHQKPIANRLSLLISFSLYVWLSVTQASAMTLKEAIEHGLTHSPRMTGANAAKSSATITAELAGKTYLPILDSNLSTSVGGSDQKASQADRPNLRDPTYSSQAGITLSQPIWDGGVRSLQNQTAKLTGSLGDMQFQETRDQFILDIVNSYFSLSQAVLELQAQETQHQLLEKQHRDSNDAFKQGLRLRRDHVRLQAEVRRSELTLIAAKSKVTQLGEDLGSKIGMSKGSVGSTETTTPKFEPLAIPERSKIKNQIGERVGKNAKTSFSRTYLARKQVFLDQQDELAITLERRQTLWPTIDLSASTGYQANSFIGPTAEPVDKNSGLFWSVQLGAKYTIWDWGQRSQNIARRLLEQASAKAVRQTSLTELEIKIKSLDRDLDEALKLLDMNLELESMESDSFAEVNRDYRLGKASYLEIVDATERKLSSRLLVVSSYFGWLRKTWDQKFYEGAVYEAFQNL